MTFVPINGVMSQALRPSKIRGVQLAIVVDNKDGQGNPGYRVKVKFPWLNEQETSFWARVAIPMGGPDRGTYVLPEIDDQVLVVFELGDINRPIVIGALWSKKQEPVEVNQSGKNNTKLIKSRSGHRVIFDDKEGAEKITIVDKTKKNKIVLDSVNKVVKIESEGDIAVIAKANVVMHSNALKIGTTEGVTGKGASLLVHSANTFGLKATNRITIGGGNTSINVSNAAATNVSGSGAGELGAAGSETAREQVQEQQRSSGAGGSGAGGGAGSSNSSATAGGSNLSRSSAGAGASAPPRAGGAAPAHSSAAAQPPQGGVPKPASKPDECKVVAIQALKSFRLCGGGAFRVSQYDGTPTKANKSRIRWSIRDAETRSDLLTPNKSVIKEKGEALEIVCVPFDWHDRTIEIGAQFGNPPKDKMFSGKAKSVEVYDWIATIRKAEKAYPSWTGVAMTNALRRVAPPGMPRRDPGAPYDTGNFRTMYDHSPPGERLAPLGPLTQSDIDRLGTWNWHAMRSGVETGIVKDANGNKLAAGHILTGLSGGVYRNRSIDVTPAYAVGVGERMDNLYATTISGDLGQVAVFVNAGTQARPYLGSHGDATDAELIGDIDGWLIGNMEPRGGSGKLLSETLLDYYCPCNKSGPSYKSRFTTFQAKALGALEAEVIRFASNYVYSLHEDTLGRTSELFSEITTESREAYAEFVGWLKRKAAGGK